MRQRPPAYARIMLMAGLTAVFVGYFAVWLPGPAAGLQLIGLEMGEWIKFLGMGMERNWFYVPPVTLGLILALLTAQWPNGRWQTWAMRGLAVLVSLLAFPAFEDLMGQARPEYLPRVQLIGLVVAAAVGSSFVPGKKAPVWLPVIFWVVLAVVGLVGAVAPLGVYQQARLLAGAAIGTPIGFGWGIWLNGVGHLVVTAVGVTQAATLARPPR